jgi:hypothetical protein
MNEAGNKAEPPSCSRPLIFLIGKNCDGHWVACEQNGTRGGLFANRAAALKFARSENGSRSPSVVLVNGTLELDMTARLALAAHGERASGPLQRQVA